MAGIYIYPCYILSCWIQPITLGCQNLLGCYVCHPMYLYPPKIYVICKFDEPVLHTVEKHNKYELIN
jgi:hypothetical protein